VIGDFPLIEMYLMEVISGSAWEKRKRFFKKILPNNLF
jgi:hypothetical protein